MREGGREREGSERTGERAREGKKDKRAGEERDC